MSLRWLLIVFCNSAIIALSMIVSFWLRFDFSIPNAEAAHFRIAVWIAVVLKTVVFLALGIHRGWWRFVGMSDLRLVFFANVLGSAGFAVAATAMMGSQFPRSIHVIDFMFCFLMTAGARFAVRLYNEALKVELTTTGQKGVLIYGAGAAGVSLLHEIRSNRSLGYEVVGFLDDNPKLRAAVLMGTPVLGCGRTAAVIVDRYKQHSTKVEEIIIAMPSASGRQMREAVANCRAAGVPCKTIPSMGELLQGKVLTSQIRNISVDDLLGREQVRLEEDRIQQKIAGRIILITGAAGSIGSELCRQTLRFGPAHLIVFDQAESDLFRIDNEIRSKFPGVQVTAEIGDIRDSRRVEEVIRSYHVQSVFHAAAYKHVPLMESHVFEAVKNNVMGTWNLARIASELRVTDFLMISSDKAVNPTNVMGATKRIAELIVGALGRNASNHTNFVCVRFGNVLGSNGSVVPTFQAQIASGGPVTVTHPEVRRYFMSVREAVQLVLQASTMGKGSDIFVLDMGDPMRILDLAHNMIRLAGLVPDEDIEVRIVGLRPGEKLYEELMTEGENITPTYHEKIKIFQGAGISFEEISNWLIQLPLLLARRDREATIEHMKAIVPEYKPLPRTPRPTGDSGVGLPLPARPAKVQRMLSAGRKRS